MRRILAAAVGGAIAFSAVPCVAQEKLTVWWVKGFYKSEDDALLATIRAYEARNPGVEIALSQYAIQDMIPRSAAALESGTPPDIAYSDSYDVQAAGKWAFDGKLEDISDIIAPMKERFSPGTIETAFLYNGKTGKKAYYGFALKLETLHIQYWKDMLATAGFKEDDIPDTWKEYWSFWCDKVQPAYRKVTGGTFHGIGSPMGVGSSDSYLSFLSWIDAYNVELVDDNGKLLVEDTKVKAGLVDALRDYTDIHARGCSPPSSTAWNDADNNIAFNNRTTAMTHNYTISIPVKWLNDASDAALTAERRAAGRKAYDEQIATAGFPRKPDGTPMTYRAAVKVGVIFEQSRNKARARDFLKFLMEERNLRAYVEGALGRWFPVTRESQKSGFWQVDRHRKAVHDQIMAGTLPFEFTKNHKFTILNNENVWAKAMNRVVVDKMSVEKAVEEMIARIREVAN